MSLSTTKSYIRYPLKDPSLFNGCVDHKYDVPEDVIKKLSKELGFSYDLYRTLLSIDEDTSKKLLNSMSRQNNKDEAILLVDGESVIGYTIDSDRLPILNTDFLDRVKSLVETSDSVMLDEIVYDKESTISSVIIKKTAPIIVTEKYENKPDKQISYDIGILLVNDELGTTSSRLVVYINDQPVYLPASVYSTSTTRYKRSTSNSLEALEVLMLKSIDDLRDDMLTSKIYDMHLRYRYNKNIVVTYEEYNELLRLMRKIPDIIEDNSYLDPLTSMYDEFERKYMNLVDQKSSYIWRCTALGDMTIQKLIETACSILRDVNFPTIDYFNVRERLGAYISTHRIAEDIAKDTSE